MHGEHILTKFWNINMLPKDAKKSKNHFHKKGTHFTNKKTPK